MSRNLEYSKLTPEEMDNNLRVFIFEGIRHRTQAWEPFNEAIDHLRQLHAISPYLLSAYLDVFTSLIREPINSATGKLDSNLCKKAHEYLDLNYMTEVVMLFADILESACTEGVLRIDVSQGDDYWMAIEDASFFELMNDIFEGKDETLFPF